LSIAKVQLSIIVQQPKFWQPKNLWRQKKVATETLATKTFVMTQSGNLNFDDEKFGANHDHNFCNRKNSGDRKRL